MFISQSHDWAVYQVLISPFVFQKPGQRANNAIKIGTDAREIQISEFHIKTEIF